MKSVVPSRNH